MEITDEESEIFVDNFLEHFGVLGMKWGSRKEAGEKNRGTKNAATVAAMGAAWWVSRQVSISPLVHVSSIAATFIGASWLRNRNDSDMMSTPISDIQQQRR